MLSQYEEEIRGCLLIEENKLSNSTFVSTQINREKIIWDSIYENVLSSYRHELEWILETKKAIEEFENEQSSDNEPTFLEDTHRIPFEVVTKASGSYILLSGNHKSLQQEQDAIDLTSQLLEA